MVLFPVPFLFLYIPARCVFGPLPSPSCWWAFCFFLKEHFKGETANLCFSSTVWIVPQKAWAICSRQSVQIGLISISLLTPSAQTLTPPSPPEPAKKEHGIKKRNDSQQRRVWQGPKRFGMEKQSAFPPLSLSSSTKRTGFCSATRSRCAVSVAECVKQRTMFALIRLQQL